MAPVLRSGSSEIADRGSSEGVGGLFVCAVEKAGEGLLDEGKVVGLVEAETDRFDEAFVLPPVGEGVDDEVSKEFCAADTVGRDEVEGGAAGLGFPERHNNQSY